MARLTPLRQRTAAGPRFIAGLLALLPACAGDASEPVPEGARREAARASEPARLRVVLLAREDGAPLAGLPVFVWPRPGEAPHTPVAGSEAGPGEIPLTGADGAATFRLLPGRYSAAAEWPAKEAQLIELRGGAQAEVELRRPSLPDRTMVLRVVSADGDEALAASEVELAGLPAEVAARGATQLSRADAGGRHTLRFPSWHPVVAIVRAEGHGEARLALRAGGAGAEAEEEIEVSLERSAAVRGRLVDAAGVPVAGAVVAARADAWELFLHGRAPPLGTRAEEVVWTAPTDEGGAFALPGLPAGVALTLDARPEGGWRPPRPREPLRLAPGEERAADLVLANGTRIEGVLLGADGAPRAGVAIWLVRGGARRVFSPYETVHEHAVTDPSGRFAFAGVEPGSWQVGPAAQHADVDGDAVVAPLPELVEVLEGMTRAEVMLRPPALLTVEGRCVGPGGEPVPGVHLIAESADQTATAISGADGAFSLGPFIEGVLELRTTAPSVGYTAGASQTVRAGDRNVTMRVERAGALRGTVVGAGGEPHVAEIELAHRDRLRGPGARRFTAGDDGAFAAQGLEAGGYVVVARAEPDLVAVRGDLSVAPGATLELALELSEGARARFTVPADLGATFFLVFVNGVPVERGPLGGRGEIETRGFPPGDLAVELHGPRGLIARQAAPASAGGIVQLDFRR